MKSTLLLSIFFGLVSWGCDSKPTQPSEAAVPAEPPTKPAETRVEAPTADTQPKSATPPTKNLAPRAAEGVKPAELQFFPPSDWTVEAASNAMRKAQYKLPRAASDTSDAELVIFYSGKMGMGPVEANLNRWAGQFSQPDGAKSREKMQTSTRKGAAGNITDATLEGTYIAEKVMGSGERYSEANWKMLGAILESDHGPYYLKLVGPKATVDAHAAAFQEFVATAK